MAIFSNNIYNEIIKGLVILFILVFIIWNAIKGETVTGKECKEEKQLTYSGLVDRIELDPSSKSQKKIFLKNGKVILQIYTFGLWNEVKPGDSVVKLNGSLNYMIYDGPDYKNVRLLEWDKACN